MLPELFLSRMERMLGEEYQEFLESYQMPQYHSLRVNLLKGTEEELRTKAGFLEEPVTWAAGGCYCGEEERPGKHPFHEAGVYYIQEASAMAPAAYLGAEPGERILDLCAAPGGKSTQIAADMCGKGLLVCNEIHPQRAKILSENIERMGIRNALVVSHKPDFLAEHFPAYFDRILVDAPCSGEGMFRKKEDAVKEWSLENVKMCADRQSDILESAAIMLRPGGRMVYSTCTFSLEEDEGTVSSFMQNHQEFHLVEAKKVSGMAPGMALYGETDQREIEKTIRLWPHKLKGEGHFVACFQKEGDAPKGAPSLYGEEKGILLKECGEWETFSSQYLNIPLNGTYLRFGDQLYLIPENTPALKGLKVLRPGLHLGTLKKKRFEPSHALALSLRPEEASYKLDLSVEEAVRYLKGETFPAQGEKGWYLITVEGYSLGWGKLAGGIMKNHYPKGLRK
ncbi:MAG: RNA methyltransferase [Lachnospiraceae bacterium]|nr:RNA methyltransferase [Lachnospiraceae bacterium]